MGDTNNRNGQGPKISKGAVLVSGSGDTDKPPSTKESANKYNFYGFPEQRKEGQKRAAALFRSGSPGSGRSQAKVTERIRGAALKCRSQAHKRKAKKK